MRRILVVAALLLAAGGTSDAAPPAENQCPTISGPVGSGVTDAIPRRLRAGDQLGYESLLALRDLLPQEIWQNRHVFFFKGMRMVIGDCHRRYPVPGFYRDATEQHADGARVDAKGNLYGYRAGLPFPPEGIDPEAPEAGVQWAWNLEHRFRGSGPFGSFRIVDLMGRSGSTLTYAGSFFLYQTRHRTDLADADYTVSGSDENLWVAGGEFREPFDARHLAWRQMRPTQAHEKWSVSDRTFVYVPTMRKVRRAATPWVDGTYMPRYRAAGDSGGGGMNILSDPFAGGFGAINPTAALSTHQTEHLPRGFTALAIRPNAYVWRVLGEREVIAPLNTARHGFPTEPNRNFGPHGLSLASDRWDVRWAIVLEGRARETNLDFETITLYLDWQTQQPLYAITRGGRGRILDVGISAHRFSDDFIGYPSWNDGSRASVFDPVAEVFYRVTDDSGWRRESYDVRSTPPPEKARRRFVSTDYLLRGH